MRFTIIQRKRRSGKDKKTVRTVWCIDFVDAQGVRHEEAVRDAAGNSTRELAKVRLRELDQACHAGIFSNHAVTLTELCVGFLADVQVRENTRRDYKVIIDQHLVPHLGADTAVQEIDVARIEGLRTYLRTEGRLLPVKKKKRKARDAAEEPAPTEAKRGPLAPATVNKALTLLVMLLNRAVKHKIIASNPALHVDKVKTDRKQRVRAERILARDEVPLMLAQAPARYAALLTTLVYSGMRISEALALRWKSVNLDANILTVEAALVRGKEGPAKSDTSHRDIDIPAVLAQVLREHKMASARKADDDLVFPTRFDDVKQAGQADSLQNVQKRGLAVALKRAGIKRATSLHDLRHGYASALLASGVPITRVSALLGHASPAITLAVYSHVIPKHKDDAAAKLAAFFTEQADPPKAASAVA